MNEQSLYSWMNTVKSWTGIWFCKNLKKKYLCIFPEHLSFGKKFPPSVWAKAIFCWEKNVPPKTRRAANLQRWKARKDHPNENEKNESLIKKIKLRIIFNVISIIVKNIAIYTFLHTRNFDSFYQWPPDLFFDSAISSSIRSSLAVV